MNSVQRIDLPKKPNPMSSSPGDKAYSHQKTKEKFWFSFLFKRGVGKFESVFNSQTCKKPFARAFVLTSLLLPFAAMSANGVYMPPPPQGVGGEDSITTATGTHCRSSMNSNRGYVDMGLTGTQGTANDIFTGYTGQRQDNSTVYARVVIPLGRAPEKIDCTRFMQLELERLEAEIKMLRYSPD